MDTCTCDTDQNRAGQSRTEQDRAEQSRTGQNIPKKATQSESVSNLKGCHSPSSPMSSSDSAALLVLGPAPSPEAGHASKKRKYVGSGEQSV
eukprot:87411-Pelagomonas_calceolata.AAC.11